MPLEMKSILLTTPIATAEMLQNQDWLSLYNNPRLTEKAPHGILFTRAFSHFGGVFYPGFSVKMMIWWVSGAQQKGSYSQ